MRLQPPWCFIGGLILTLALDMLQAVYYDGCMTTTAGSLRLVRGPVILEGREVLDHYVSSLSWSIPTRIKNLRYKSVKTDPDVFMNDDALWYSNTPPRKRVRIGPGLLEDFLKLESAPTSAIVAYARKWGPLWLCIEHNLPKFHSLYCKSAELYWGDDDATAGQPEKNEEPFIADDDDLFNFDALGSGAWFQEDFDGWRDLSRQARAIIRIARRLHDGKLGVQSDWDALPFVGRLLFMDHLAKAEDGLADGDVSIPPPIPGARRVAADTAKGASTIPGMPDSSGVQAPDELTDEFGEPLDYDPDYRLAIETREKRLLADSLQYQRIVIAGAVNYWLRIGVVRPRLSWTPDKPLVHLDGYGLFGALAVQIMFDCSRTDGLAVCSSCGTPFLPGPRRPRRDRNIYCSDCGIRAATRDAAARYRQTKKYRATYQSWLQKRRGSSI